MSKTAGYIDTQILRKFDKYEVYVDGEFICSADTVIEAAVEVEKHFEEMRKTIKMMEEFVAEG